MKDKIINILNQYKTDSLVSVEITKKKVSGQYTEDDSITFTFKKKKPLSELSPSEVIPTELVINNEVYKTDVVEGTRMRIIEAPPIDYNEPFDDWRHTNTPNDLTVNPIMGGVGIGGQNKSDTGTGGVLCKDNDTGALCLLTNAHVITGNTLTPAERLSTDTPYYMAMKFDQDGRTIGRAYKIKHISSAYSNTVDCGVIALDGSDVDLIVSRKQVGMSFANVTKFATTSELNSMGFGTRLYSSGLTTGPKGEVGMRPGLTEGSGFREATVKLFLSSNNYSTTLPYPRHGGSPFNATMTNCMKYIATKTDVNGTPVYGVAIPGDSGSAVFAEFNGVMKVVGLCSIASADGYFAGFCRIDNICEALNISEWPEDTITTGQNQLLPYLDSNSPEFLDVPGLDNNPYKIVNGKKYWAIGTIKK